MNLSACQGFKEQDSRPVPIRYLFHRAGFYGYLLLMHPVIQFFARRGRADGYYTVDASAALQAGYGVLVFFCVAHYLLLSGRGRRAVEYLTKSPSIYLLAFIFLCMLSFIWSERPLYSWFMGFESLAFFLLLVVVADRLRRSCSPEEMIDWVLLWMVWRIGWALLHRVVAGRLDYSLFAAGRLETGIIFFLALYISRRGLIRWTVMAFALLSGSNKMYAAMGPGALLGLFSAKWHVRLLSFAGIVLLFASLSAIGPERILHETIWRGRAGVGMEYTSGRNNMWDRGMLLFRQRPFLGYGFVSGERDRILVGGVSAVSIHNMALSAALAVGFTGPLLLLLYFLETAVLCCKSALPRNWMIGFLSTLAAAFIFSMTGPGLGGRVYGGWVATVFAMTVISMVAQDSVDEYAEMEPALFPELTEDSA